MTRGQRWWCVADKVLELLDRFHLVILRDLYRGTMDSQSGSDQNYWGSYHFMYGPLADGEILILEEAIFARRLGRYEEARQIWDDKLPPSCELPVLTIERAELEARLMRHRFRLEILETFFNSQEKWRRDPSEQEINLITVLLAAAKIEVYGTLRPALMEVRRIQSMWQDRSVEELSLIEVRARSHHLVHSRMIVPFSYRALYRGPCYWHTGCSINSL